MTFPSPGEAEPLFAWVVRETSVDSTGTWETTPQRQLVVNIDAYLQVLERLGAKVAGLLLTLSALSVVDPETGRRFIQASQERLGRLVSGGDGGWTEHPTREALKVLISAGFVQKEDGRALGRSRGSEAPKWYLTSALFDTACSPFATAELEHPNDAPSNLEPASNRHRKNYGPNPTGLSPRKTPLKLRPAKPEASHGMDGNTHLHQTNDDNDGFADLLSLAVIQELGSLGWDRPEQSVRQYGAFPLGAWLTVSRHTRRNPGGFIRTQTTKPHWPHFPDNWDPETTTLIVDSSGRVQAVPRQAPGPSPTEPARLSVSQIHEILEGAGELGSEVRREWLNAADESPRASTPEERSRRLQETGTALLSRYGLLPQTKVETP